MSPYDAALFHDDYLFSGQGLAMKGRGVICRENVIANANQGVGIINMNPSITNHDRVDAEALATFRTGFLIDQFPLSQNGYSIEGDGVMPVEVALIMENTTVIDCYQGLRSIERDMGVNHESRSVFDGFIAWGISQGLSIVYQADYSFKDVFISGRNNTSSVGAFLWKHSHNHVFENIKMVDLAYGVMVSKLVESGNGLLKTRNNGVTPWYFIDLTTENVGEFYQILKEDPSTATVYTEHSDNPIHLASSELVSRPVTFTILDSTELVVDYTTNDFRFEIDGIITDDLGSYDMGIKQAEAQGTLRLDYPQRIYEFASQAKFEEYLSNHSVYKDVSDNNQLYFIIHELLPNRRDYQYTSFPIRIKIMNAPNTGVFANPQVENATALLPKNQLISRNATITQSSTATGLTYDGEAIDPTASKAIDGNNNGRINCQIFQRGLVPLGSFSQTQQETEPWIELDLGEEKLIDYIDIWNTVELNGVDIETNSTTFQDFYVLISSVPFNTSSLTTARGVADYEYYEPTFMTVAKRKLSLNNLNTVGRYVRIQAVGNTVLKLAEIEVIGKTNAVQLPVELLSFEASAASNEQRISQLRWITISEINTQQFDIQHATSPEQFKTIETKVARGTISTTTSYKVDHLTPKLGKNYYRLKMIDWDGHTEYSPIRIVEFEENNLTFTVYPNPSQGNIVLEFSQPERINFIEIYNAQGQLIDTQNNLSATTLSLNYPSGVYTIIIKGNNHKVWTKRVIIL